MLKVTIQQQSPNNLNIQLYCKNNELLALVGSSGSGKTSVLHCIAGLNTSFEGVILCNGQVWHNTQRNIHISPQQRRVGMVFQNYALFPHLTVEQNIGLAVERDKVGRQRRVKELLALVHLSGMEKRYPSQLSGGQQQRVAIARALAREPQVLLLDEPFSAVDKVTRRKLYLELQGLRRGLDMPIILVTHDLDEAAMLADQMCVMYQGRTLQQGTPEAVLYQPDNVLVARQVDVRNMFKATIGYDGEKYELHWHQYKLELTNKKRDFQAGSTVNWTLPPAKVLLHQRVRPSRGEHENHVSGTVVELLTLKGITTVLVKVECADSEIIQMDLPEHVATRNQLRIGEYIHFSLLSDAIHVMPS